MTENDVSGNGEARGRKGNAPRFPRLILREDALRRVSRGHCWIFSNEVAQRDPEAVDGGEVAIISHRGDFLGSALYGAKSLIAARLYSRASVAFDAAWIDSRIEAAATFRSRFVPGADACRLVYGDSDALPGLVIDRYGDAFVIQLLTVALDRRRDLVIEALRNLFAPKVIVERSDSPLREYEGLESRSGVVYGSLDGALTVRRDGIDFTVDLIGGQKTGLFLDQAGNWPGIRRLAKGARVLDLFCHSGGWSLNALAAEAQHVVAVDSSRPALDLLRAATTRNGLDASRLEIVEADCFDFLRDLRDTFDVIVCDPPAFAKSRKHLTAARRGYHEINRLSMKHLRPGGVLITCSCSHHLDRADFLETLRLAARDMRRSFRVLPWMGQPADHPMLLGLPESEYLKVIVLADATLDIPGRADAG